MYKPGAFHKIVWILCEQGNPDRAIPIVEKITGQLKSVALFDIVCALCKQGNIDKALLIAEKIITGELKAGALAQIELARIKRAAEIAQRAPAPLPAEQCCLIS